MNPEVNTPQYVIALARDLRLNMTETENLLWRRLRRKQLAGYKFRNQHPVYRYILDFYCHEKKLAIEIDGQVHSNREDYDEFRDHFLSSIGIETLRFSADEVKLQLDDVINEIINKLNEEKIYR